MSKKTIIGLMVAVLVGGGGYWGYTVWHKNYLVEQERLTREAAKSLRGMITDSSGKLVKLSPEERKKRIEDGTAITKEVEEIKPNGDKYTYTLVDGEKEGPAFGTYSSGRKSSEGNYKDGYPVGVHRVFYDKEGSPAYKEIHYGSNKRKDFYAWYEDGALATQSHTSEEGGVEGFWHISWYPDGTKGAEIKYNKLTKLSDEIRWDQNGRKKSMFSVGSSLEGAVRIDRHWYNNGQQRSENMRVGEKGYSGYQNNGSGWYKEWDEEGHLVIDEIWVDGKIDLEKTPSNMIRKDYLDDSRY